MSSSRPERPDNGAVPIASVIEWPRPPLAPPPLALTSLIGREAEIASVREILLGPHARLVTLTGPGGVGKSRLALAVGEAVGREFPDGVAFLSLASVRDPELVAGTIARALGITEPADWPVSDTLIGFLHRRRMLLILDNFEHLLTAAPLMTDLLLACPDLALLVTSRERLRLSGERIYPVPPLALPIREADGVRPFPSTEPIAEASAVRLFVERSQAVNPAFALTETNAATVADICRALDGLPLAIELAAAQTRAWPPSALLARMGQLLPILTGGPRDAPARLRTMRNAIAWSYDLLTLTEQAVFRRLSVFVGGCTLDAAETVCAAAGDLDADLLDAVASLVDQSLLRQFEGPGGELRIGMFETLREFGLDMLAASGEEDVTWSAHTDWCLKRARSIHEPTLVLFDFEPSARLAEAEHDNLRAALAWLERTGDRERLLRLAAALGGPWWATGYHREGRNWLERALAAAPDTPSADRAEAHAFLGVLAHNLGNEVEAASHLKQGEAIARQVGLAWLEASAVVMRGIAALNRGDFETPESMFIRGLELASADDPTLGPLVTYHRGRLAYTRGELAQADHDWEAALAAGRALGRPMLQVWCLDRLALLAIEQGDLRRAAGALREHLVLGPVAIWPPLVIVCQDIAGMLAQAIGQSERAAWLLGAWMTEVERTGQIFLLPEHAAFERASDRARQALGEAEFARAWAEGRAMPYDRVVSEITAVLDAADALQARPVSGPVAPATLTPREREVLSHIVEGLSDKEIAAALGINRTTVSKHVSTILGKLGVPSRTAAATYATRHGLI